MSVVFDIVLKFILGETMTDAKWYAVGGGSVSGKVVVGIVSNFHFRDQEVYCDRKMAATMDPTNRDNVGPTQ